MFVERELEFWCLNSLCFGTWSVFLSCFQTFVLTLSLEETSSLKTHPATSRSLFHQKGMTRVIKKFEQHSYLDLFEGNFNIFHHGKSPFV